jgi:hypothetical protein
VAEEGMADSPETIVLAQLRAIRSDIADVQGSSAGWTCETPEI